MIDRQKLLADLKPLLREVEADLRARCDEVAQINDSLKKEYEQARSAERTAVTFEEWRADLITQVAVAWVLSCVFVRFLEDNALIAPPRVSGLSHGAGQDAGLQRARDERETYFRTHPRETDRDYLLAVFDDLAKHPGTKDVFGPHNPVSAYRNWLSGDAAQKLIEFFQKIDADGTGEIIHDFTDPTWDTRFLGDLYQDLSEAARKKYALLQTPVFVEEFILERTLEPAIKEFGLKDFKMIDPACGSGHFLLGSFARILKHWRAKEPGTNDRELVNHALASVHGVDLNPYAIAIARFRLLVAAMRECHITKLRDAPAFAFNLVCGDSLLHGEGAPGSFCWHDLDHVYQAEDKAALVRILKPGHYHAVVANPPYITPKDRALNDAYRERYSTCHMKYSLSIPFMQRLFQLAISGYGNAQQGGFVGQITSNSFMKREFGKKLIEEYFPGRDGSPGLDLTHIIDASGASLPGHNTPTVLIFGRNRAPVGSTVRAVMGIRGKPFTQGDPPGGQAWAAIISQIDQPGSQSEFVSVSDSQRELFHKHPWSIGGGGAAELKEHLDGTLGKKLEDLVDSIGITSFTLEDDIFILPPDAAARRRFARSDVRPMIVGDLVRDWTLSDCDVAVFPYDADFEPIPDDGSQRSLRHLWQARTCLANNKMFGGETKLEAGLRWYEYGRLTATKLRTPLTIVFAFVATHNHFVLDRGGKVFNRSSPVIKLPPNMAEQDHLGLIGFLNSSVGCFWMKQVFHDKGSTVDAHGARQTTVAFENFREFTATGLLKFPVPDDHPTALPRHLDQMARHFEGFQPAAVLKLGVPTMRDLDSARLAAEDAREQMIAAQEELDWQCYRLYGLVDGELSYAGTPLPSIGLGERAFEIVLARRMAKGEVQTTWFERHGSKPITEPPADWPEDYKRLVERRVELIETDRNIGLIEQPEYKRRWNTVPWESQLERALRSWLLDRLESYLDFDGRMNDQKEVTACEALREPRLTTIAKVADVARADKDFMQVAEIFTGRMDFDVGVLVGELIAVESVPALPALRYKPSATDKRAAWERTWELQRLEDAIDSLFDELNTKARRHEGEKEGVLETYAKSLAESSLRDLRDFVFNPLHDAAKYLAEAVKQKLNLTSDTILKPVQDAARRARKAAVGDIPVPPKYSSADFRSSNFWRLRGKLDVPKERWVSFPHCEGEDGTLVIAWAGYDHLQMARAIAERYELAKEQEGRKLVPLLAAIGQLIPWLKQWHNELDPAYGTRMGDYFAKYLAEEAKALGMSVEQVMAWAPPEKPKKAGRKKK